MKTQQETIADDGCESPPLVQWRVVNPFLKWAGGKRRLAKDIAAFVPAIFNSYFEPFLGGAALFFYLAPRSARLSDINADLINVYLQVRDDVTGVLEGLRRFKVNRTAYHRVRSANPSTALERAVRFLYLNKTAFNGLYRVNRLGQFNVPFAGRQGRRLFDEEELSNASALLQGCEIEQHDFAKTFLLAKPGDVIYCDPPYTVLHNDNGFLRYNEALFSWQDQQRLALAAKQAVARGAYVLVSNAAHRSVRDLYAGFTVKTLRRKSSMSARPQWRGETSEYLFIGTPRG